MKNGMLLKKVNTGSRIVFEDPDKFCLLLKGRINTVAHGQRHEVGSGGVIDSSVDAYALENSELLFIHLEKLRELQPALAAKIIEGMKGSEASGQKTDDGLHKSKEGEEDNRHPTSNSGRPIAEHERTAYTYSVDIQCPVCEGHFKANKLFESKLKQLSHDDEMRTRFEDIEPIHYKVWLCPGCLYANFMIYFSDLSTSKRSTLKKSIETRKNVLADLPEPGGVAEKAVNDYRLVIECLTQIKAESNIIASAWLNLAWLYDDRGDVESASAARKNSLEAYENCYFLERSLAPSMEINALYIIGALNKKLGNIKRAHEYFLKVLHYRGHSMAILTELARDGLEELKQMAKETA
jgi:uncharacterized protein (DUF2225 family)